MRPEPQARFRCEKHRPSKAKGSDASKHVGDVCSSSVAESKL